MGSLLRSLRPLRRARIAGLFVVLLLVAVGCGSSSDPLNTEAVRQFDIANNAIADLTPDDSVEQVPRDDLMRSVARAEVAGTDLRIVIAARDGEFVSAKSVVDRYGGTAIAYQAVSTGFEAASRDMSAEQLDRAVNAAKVQADMGGSASAFVDVIESEGLSGRAESSSRTALLALLIPAALFMLWGAWTYFQARKRRVKRQLSFDERKWVLTDWARQLGPEVESLRPLVGASPIDSAQKTWSESQEFVANIVPTLETASSIGELDAAEMRIGRTAIKLRDLRQLLER